MSEIERLQAQMQGYREEASELRVQNARMEAALLAIATMDVLTREGEDPAHEIMRRLAKEALSDPVTVA